MKKLLVILSFLSTAYAECDPVELVELRTKLTERCLRDNVPEYNCNSRLRELMMMEQDVQIILREIEGGYKTKITTLELEK
jgi:hypothetical protein